jgi:hypothetical protein
MVSERIDESSYSPTVLVANRRHHFGSCCDSPVECGIRVLHDQEQPNRPTAERLGAEVEVVRGLVGEPESGAAHGQLSDYFTLLVVDPKRLGRSERSLVELNRSCPVSNGKHGDHGDILISRHKVPSLAALNPRRTGRQHAGIERSEEYVCEETGDEVVLMKDRAGRVIGLETLSFSVRDSDSLRVALETQPD